MRYQKQTSLYIKAILLIFIVLFQLNLSVTCIEKESGLEYVTKNNWKYISAYNNGFAIVGTSGSGFYGEYGYIDRFGKIISAVVWDGAKAFSHGLAPVKKNGKWGFIDEFANLVIEPKYEDANIFVDGFARVKLDDKYAFINTQGYAVSYGWEDACCFSEGLAAVKNEDGWGFIDTNGNLVIENKYVSATYFYDGLAPVATKSASDTLTFPYGYGYIRPDGSMAIDFIYDKATIFYNGYAKVDINNYADSPIAGGTHVIDKDNNIVLSQNPPQGGSGLFFSGTFYGIKNKNGWISTKLPRMDFTHDDFTLGNGIEIVKKVNFMGEFNRFDEIKETDIQNAASDIIIITLENGKMGIVNFDMNIIVPFEWEYLNKYSEGFVTAKKDDTYGILNVNTNEWFNTGYEYECSSAVREGRTIIRELYGANYRVARFENDGELFNSDTVIATASKTQVNINNYSIDAYKINNDAYIDIKILEDFGFDIMYDIAKNSIFITGQYKKDNYITSGNFIEDKSYFVFESDKAVAINNITVHCVNIDSVTAVKASELRHIAEIFQNEDELSVYINYPYMQGEGIKWRWVTETPEGSTIHYRNNHFIICDDIEKTTRFYDENMNFVFQIESSCIPNGMYKDYFVMSDKNSNTRNVYKLNGEFIESFKEGTDLQPEYLADKPKVVLQEDEYPKLSILDRKLPSGNGAERERSSIGKCGYLNESGYIIIDYNWMDAQPFVNGTALVSETAKTIFAYKGTHIYGQIWGLIDTSGKYVFEPAYENIIRQTNGNFIVIEHIQKQTTTILKYGMISETGDILLPVEYSGILEFIYNCDYAKVENLNEKYSIIDKGGQFLTPFLFNNIFEEDNNRYSVLFDKKRGIISLISNPHFKGEVYINGQLVSFDTVPLLIESRTMVPIRAVFEKLGYEVSWDDATKTAELKNEDNSVKISENKNTIIKNGGPLYSDMAALNYNGRIHVPLRAISESLGCEVNYDNIKNEININTK